MKKIPLCPRRYPIFLPLLILAIIVCQAAASGEGGLIELSAAPCFHGTVPVHVTRIIDGDTVIVCVAAHLPSPFPPACVNLRRVRLADIDAPELKQPHGESSRHFLADLVSDKPVHLVSRKTDRYGRLLATLFVAGKNINLAMVRSGHAWRYRYARCRGALAAAESKAKIEGIGLWMAEKPTAPWEFRRGQQHVCRSTKKEEL